MRRRVLALVQGAVAAATRILNKKRHRRVPFLRFAGAFETCRKEAV